MSLVHYLLIYDIRARRLLSAAPFKSADEAVVAYASAEREHFGDLGVEIVLVGSDSLETVKKTHGHYFTEGSRDVVLPSVGA